MKEILIATLFAFTFVTIQNTSAHEGHDAPGSIQAQHGGTVKTTTNLFIELVQEGNALMLFPMTHEYKPVPLKEVQMEATAQLPKGKTKSLVKLAERSAEDASKTHYLGTFDAKGAHRYTLSVTAKYTGKKETATFQVEPKN